MNFSGSKSWLKEETKTLFHIEQEPAISPLAEFPDKRPFIHFGLGESHIARHVFDCHAAPEKILDPPNPVGDVVERFRGVRNWQKVMKIDPMHAGPAEMVGDPFRLETLGKSLERRKVVPVERSGRCDRHGYAMHHDWVVIAYPLQNGERLSSGHHEVFGNHFEPVDPRLSLEDLAVVLRP